MSQIDEIKNSLNIVDIVSETVKLRRTGKAYIGFCPFHANTHTPAFAVFPDSGTWRCFGACAEGGDVFSYIMKRDGLDFQQAVELLAQRAGIKLEKYQSVESGLKKEKRVRLQELLELAAAVYHDQLLRHPAGERARSFLEKRGVLPATRDDWKLGYALGGWDAMTQHLLSSGYSREEAIEAGMVSEQRDAAGDPVPGGRIYDRFRNRLMIPIRDPSGGMIGFGARILDPNDVPKFLNSPQTVLFDKGKTLFGYDRARASIREQDRSVIVEGYFDVIILHQAGFTNTVAPMGTALGTNQVRLLTRQSKRILLALDADAAGDSATLKGIDVIREAVKGENPSDTGALIRQEGDLKADIRVTKIPEGQDPDEVVLRDPAEWRAILENAKPIVTFRMETAAAGKDLSDAKVKQAIADEVMPLIREVSNRIERETYRQQLAAFLKIDERLLAFAALPEKSKPRRSKNPPLPAPTERPRNFILADPKKGTEKKERTLIGYLLHGLGEPGDINLVDREFGKVFLPSVSVEDFTDPQLREIAKLYFEGVGQDSEPDLAQFIRDRLSEACVALFHEIWSENLTASSSRKEILSATTRLIGMLRLERVKVSSAEEEQIKNDLPDGDEMKIVLSEQIKLKVIERKRIDSLLAKLKRNECFTEL